LTLTPHVDLFGAETSRMAVLVFGMFISVAGSVAVTLLAGSLASYRRASRIDPLTGVRNRMDFDETLARELERSRRHDRALSLVILDLDYFKRINDEFKHAAGDDVLRTFVMDLTGMLRKTDTVFRYGGEEFAVLLPETTMDAAHSVIDRVRETFASSPMAGLEKLGIVTFSAGVASWDGQESADEFIDRADAAMYEAKNSGRNRVVSARPKRTLRLTGGDRKVV
jgi:diguanylate cyclase (GGDEF)-like protein